MSHTPIVAVISAYYTLEDMTIKFLDNLMTYTTVPIKVFLTNAESKPIEHPLIYKRIDIPKNNSFSHSMNQGIKEALKEPDIEYFCIIGNDVFPKEEGWLNRLIEVQRASGAYITCPIPTHPEFQIMKVAHCTEDKGIYYECNKMFPAICWLIPRDVIEKIGLFDEQFHIGCYEDNDYCKRVRLENGRIIVVKGVIVEHLLSQTLSKVPNSGNIMDINGKRFNKKWEVK